MDWFYWNVPAVTKMWICVIPVTWLQFSHEVAVLFLSLSLQAVGVFQDTWNDRRGAMVWSQTAVHIWIWLPQMNQILADQPILNFLKYEKKNCVLLSQTQSPYRLLTCTRSHLINRIQRERLRVVPLSFSPSCVMPMRASMNHPSSLGPTGSKVV